MRINPSNDSRFSAALACNEQLVARNPNLAEQQAQHESFGGPRDWIIPTSKKNNMPDGFAKGGVRNEASKKKKEEQMKARAERADSRFGPPAGAPGGGDSRNHTWSTSTGSMAEKVTDKASTGSGWKEMSPSERLKAYAQACRKVGYEGTMSVLEAIRCKMELQKRGDLHLRRAFKYFDADGSNTIDVDEFSQAMPSFGLQFSEAQVLALFSLYDKSGTGDINYEDFTNVIANVDPLQRGAARQGRMSRANSISTIETQPNPATRPRRASMDQRLVTVADPSGRTRHIVGQYLNPCAAKQLQELSRTPTKLKHGQRGKELPLQDGRYGHMASMDQTAGGERRQGKLEFDRSQGKFVLQQA